MPQTFSGDHGDEGTSTPSPTLDATAWASVARARALRAWMLLSGLNLPPTCGAVLGMMKTFSVDQSRTTVSEPSSLMASLARVVYIMLTSPAWTASARALSSGMTLNSIESRCGRPFCQ